MKDTDLSPFGLDINQSKTYLAILELGPVSILEISKKTEINRSMLYVIVDSLIKLGLVYKSVRAKKIRFIARDPTVFQSILAQKLQKFEKLLPELNVLAASGSTKPTITLHEKLEGVKQVYLASIHAKEKKLYAFVGVESLLSKTNVLETFWDEEFKNERKKRNVFGQLLVPDNIVGKKFQAKDNKNFRESRLVDSQHYNFPAEILIYDTTVAFISYTQHEEYAIEIKSPMIAQTLKMVWRFMWEAS